MVEKQETAGTNNSIDKELNDLLSLNSQLLGAEGLERLILKHQKFNTPVWVGLDDGSKIEDKNFQIKRVLREMPDFIEMAKGIKLTPDKAQDLLETAFDSDLFDFSQTEVYVSLFTKVFNQAEEKRLEFSKQDISRIKKMISLAGKYGVINHSLYAFSTALRVGLSVEQSTSLIMKFPKADGHLAGYSFSPFISALNSLVLSDIPPDLVVKTFKALSEDRPYYRQSAFNLFEEAVLYHCPSGRMTPEKLLRDYFENPQEGDMEEYLSKVLDIDGSKKLPTGGKGEITSSLEDKNSYFTPKKGLLEYLPVPYRIKMGLNRGEVDLEYLTPRAESVWVEKGQGFFVFDPSSSTWYSLGGKTEIKGGRVLHFMSSYDIYQLSKTPLMFRVSPEDFEIMLFMAPDGDSFLKTYEKPLRKFFAAAPGGSDYSNVANLLEFSSGEGRARSFIVSSVGITEFSYPHDISKIKQMGEKMRELKDQFLLNFDWQGLSRYGQRMDYYTFVRILIDDLNTKLPSGFSINLYPRGSDLEQIVKKTI